MSWQQQTHESWRLPSARAVEKCGVSMYFLLHRAASGSRSDLCSSTREMLTEKKPQKDLIWAQTPTNTRHDLTSQLCNGAHRRCCRFQLNVWSQWFLYGVEMYKETSSKTYDVMCDIIFRVSVCKAMSWPRVTVWLSGVSIKRRDHFLLGSVIFLSDRVSQKVKTSSDVQRSFLNKRVTLITERWTKNILQFRLGSPTSRVRSHVR